jgi:hypothetical protein
MKRTFFILLSLIISLNLFIHKVEADVTSVITAVDSVPVSDALIEQDIELFKQKEIGSGGSQNSAIKRTAGSITNTIKDIASKLPSLNLPTIPIPQIGGIDIGSWAGGIGNAISSIGSALKSAVPTPAWDSLTITLVRLATDKIFDDMTNWVNTGFKGNPGFATNLNDWLKKSSDSVVGEALNEITNGFACQPFRLELKAAVTRDFGYTGNRYFQNSCSLSTIEGNVNNFIKGDFSQGGWPAWFAITQVDENNPYGEYMMAVNNISLNIQGARNIEVTKLNWSAGFLGTRKCAVPAQISTLVKAPDWTINNPDMIPQTKTDPDPTHCLVWEETTPGHLIADQVSKVVGTSVDQLNLANRFDEFLGAVVNQLTNRIFSPRGFITNTSGSTYKPEPITGTVDYGGGSGTSSSVGDCTVDKTDAVVGDSVNWGVNFSAGNNSNPQFTWSGTDFPSVTTASSSNIVTYQTSGSKTMNVSVTYQEPDLSSFDPTTQTYTVNNPVTKTLQCAQIVNVARYHPIVASCIANISHAIAGKDLVTYTFSISGGSGSLYSFTAVNGNQYDKAFSGSNNFGFVFIGPNNIWTGALAKDAPGGGGQFLGIPQPPVEFSQDQNGMVIKVGKIYDHPEDPVGFEAKIIDADNTVPVLPNIGCGNVTITN